MFGVFCDQREPVVQRSGSDQQIGIVDQFTLLLQVAVDSSRPRHDLFPKRDNDASAALDLEHLNLTIGVFGMKTAQDLVPSDHGKLETAVKGQVVSGRLENRLISPLDDLGKSIGIQQDGHRTGHGSGRRKRLRSSAKLSTSKIS